MWVKDCQQRKQTLQRRTHFTDTPIKPQRVYEEMNRAFGRDVRYVSTIGLSQIAGGQFLHVYGPRHWINAGQAGPLGWTLPAALGVVAADPEAEVVALSGDYDFQFMIEELAVGAQFRLPYVHVVVNNAYLGLIRQSQRGFEMDYHVQLSFDNINASEDLVQGAKGYGVDHVKVAEGLGCKALRVFDPEELGNAFIEARKLAAEYRVPVVVEVILERVTNVSMGTEIDKVTEFEELALYRRRRPDRDLHAGLNAGLRRDCEWWTDGVRILIAPDKFKGSLEAPRSSAALAAGLLAACCRRPTVDVAPVADGGEGTVDAALGAGFRPVTESGDRSAR